jgi:transposase
MMGRLNQDQGQLFYSFNLDEAVPDDHLVRKIAAVLDLSWVHGELAAYYSSLGRPSIDPVLMIRMLILGYVFAIRSERALCREVQVNLAYRWFCGLSIEDKLPITRPFRGPATSVSAAVPFSAGVRACRWGLYRSRPRGWRRLCRRCQPDPRGRQ